MTVRLRTSRLSWRAIDGQIVVLDLERSEYFVVNDTGAVVWELLADGTTMDDLVAALVGRFGIDVEAAELDAAEFVAALRASGLLAD